MIRTDAKTKCCGCKTCSLVCPESCISFSEDAIGALYPVVDSIKCIHCDNCEQVCPIQRTFDNNIGMEAFAAFSKDGNVRFRGSSGGLFEIISTWVVENGGSVFASKFDENLKLKGFEATTVEEVRELTKSKYLQSDNSSLFPVIKERVRDGKYTLFCGTPCQVSALKYYLGNYSTKENVLFLDFFCHGVPSQNLFDKCIDLVEHRENVKIISYEFRSKKQNGATPHYYTVEYDKKGNKKKKTDLYLKDPFYLGFQKYITLRDSCYRCPYGKGNHQGDITIGDFHDIDKYIKGINRFDGVSIVIVNTEKGQQLWKRIKNQLTVYEMSIQKLYDDKQIYAGGTEEPKRRSEFINDMENMPFSAVADKWFNTRAEWKKEIYYALPAPIRKTAKNIIGL